MRAVLVGDEDVAVDRLAQGVAQRPRLQRARLGQQRVVEPLADGDEPQQLLGRLAQPLDPQHQRVAQGVGRGAAAVEPGRQQLLDVQRVAARPRPQPVEQLGRGRLAEDVLELAGELVERERREREPARVRVALELGEQRPQRMAAVQLVRPVGRDEQHALAREAAAEERERRPRRAVRPVQVLDQQQHRPVRGEAVEQRQQAFEQPRLRARVRIGRVRGGRGAGQQRRDRGAQLRRQRGIAGAGQRPQRGHERDVGQLALAEVDAVAREHEHIRAPRRGARARPRAATCRRRSRRPRTRPSAGRPRRPRARPRARRARRPCRSAVSSRRASPSPDYPGAGDAARAVSSRRRGRARRS